MGDDLVLDALFVVDGRRCKAFDVVGLQHVGEDRVAGRACAGEAKDLAVTRSGGNEDGVDERVHEVVSEGWRDAGPTHDESSSLG